MGCWKEVHYEPDKTEPMARQRGLAADSLFPSDPPVSPQAEETPAESSSQRLAAVKEKRSKHPQGPQSYSHRPSGLATGKSMEPGSRPLRQRLAGRALPAMLEQAASAAQLLHLELEPLPNVAADKEPVATVVTYLLDQQGSRLAGKL